MTTTPLYEPRPPRFSINQRVLLVRADGNQLPVTIMNVSQQGFRLEVTVTPTIGEQVVLRGEAGDVPAQIRWALGNDAGGIFLRPKDD